MTPNQANQEIARTGASSVADGGQSVILKQVNNGIAVRMAGWRWQDNDNDKKTILKLTTKLDFYFL